MKYLYLTPPFFFALFFAVWAYLAAENNVVFWDFAMYFDMAFYLWNQPSFGAGVNVFLESLTQNYNLFFSFPSLLSFSFFDPTRTVFILTNFTTYFMGSLVALALIIRRLFAWHIYKALFVSLTLAPFIPFFWVPLLEGYPDHGATALLLFATALALTPKQSWKDMIIIGGLLGASIVFRRHFAYPVLALLLTMGLFSIFDFLRVSWKEKWSLFFKYCTLGAALIGTIGLFEPIYFKNMLTTNYLSLYESYAHTAAYFTLYVLSQLGVGLFILSLFGFYILWQTKPKLRHMLLKYVTLILVWFLLWSLGPAQAGHHYLISLLPLLPFIGLAGFLTQSWERLSYRIGGGILFLFLAVNSLYSFYLAPTFIYPSDKPELGLMSASRIPWVRQDMDELKALAHYVSQQTTNQDRIVTVGSSFTFNQHMLAVLLQGNPAQKRLLFAPETDSSQQHPFHAFTYGTLFVVATPTQYHLTPSKQNVVGALASLFPLPEYLGSYYQKENIQFSLDRNVTLTIWRRIKPLPQKVLEKALKHIAKSSKQE